MPRLDVALPAGHTLVSFTDRPDLARPSLRFNPGAWPEFMLQDPVVDEHWHLLDEAWPDFQLTLLDPDSDIVATNNSAPLTWAGADEDLPAGWDDQLVRSASDHAAGRPVDTLGALQVVVRPDRRGSGLAGVMVEAMRANARAHGLRAVIACVRPTDKVLYPLAPIERYARWRRDDGLPFDAWIRLHVRAGGRVVRGVPDSMRIQGTVAEWESWTAMAFPESGTYVVPGAIAVIEIDREKDLGIYHDPNVWVVHSSARAPGRSRLGDRRLPLVSSIAERCRSG